MLAPAIDADGPWIDLQKISEDVANRAPTAIDWDHDYGPLDWPRDGRELLRDQGADVRPTGRPRCSTTSTAASGGEHAAAAAVRARRRDRRAHPDWFQKIRVAVSGLRSEQFVLAGQMLDIDSPRAARAVGRRDAT